MSLTEIAEQVNSLAYAWEEFKQTNNERLSTIERKGNVDPLQLDKLDRINDSIDAYKSRMERLEAFMQRPDSGVESKAKNNSYEHAEYEKAFSNYIRKGIESGLENFEKKALSVNSDADGGFLVNPAMSQNIITTLNETSPIRLLATVEIISSDALEILEDKDVMTSGWTTETSTVSTTSNSRFGKRSIPVHELYAQPKATQKLIDDSAVDIESWLSGKITESFAIKENAAFVNGDGVGKPRGILSYAAGTTWGKIEQVGSGTSGTFDGDDVIEVFYRLKEPYMHNATFLMNRSTVKIARTLKETVSGQYLWQPGLAIGTPDSLMGVPVAQAADMPTPAANSLSIAVGDFKQAYMVVDRVGIRILRDPYTDKPFVKFYATKRVGGDVVNFDAIKLLKLA